MNPSSSSNSSGSGSDSDKGSSDVPDSSSSIKLGQEMPGHGSSQGFDNQQAPSSFGFFSNTPSMFSSWLSKITEGERANISSKDLNAFAPTSFWIHLAMVGI